MNKMQTCYAIPGLGFTTSVFQKSDWYAGSVVGCDYHQFSYSHFDDLVVQVSSDIPDGAMLVGWSFGGIIAIQMALRFPKKVSKLILLSSQPGLMETRQCPGIIEENAVHLHALLQDDVDAFHRQFLKLVNFPNKQLAHKKTLSNCIAQIDQATLLQQYADLMGEDLYDSYSAIQADVLHIIAGSDAVLRQDAEVLASAFPALSIVTVQNAGHAGFITHAKYYRDVIQEFLYACID